MIRDDRIQNLEDLKSYMIINEDGWLLPYVINPPYPNILDSDGNEVESLPS